MKISHIMAKFTIFYIGGVVILSIIATALKINDLSIFGLLLIVFALRHLVSEYMQEHQLEDLPSETYWSFFLASFGIVMVLNILVAFFVFSNHTGSNALMTALLITAIMNGVAVAAGLMQAKKLVLKKVQTFAKK